jgi:hypothetical protein
MRQPLSSRRHKGVLVVWQLTQTMFSREPEADKSALLPSPLPILLALVDGDEGSGDTLAVEDAGVGTPSMEIDPDGKGAG